MKKNKTLVVALAIVLTLSIGYSLFSQTINVTGSAKAEGDFGITSYCYTGIHQNIASQFSTYSSSLENSYTNDSCTVTNNNISFAVNFTKPGGIRFFTIKTTNTGSIAAKLDSETGIVPVTYDLCYDGANDGSVKDGTISDSECINMLEEETGIGAMIEFNFDNAVFERADQSTRVTYFNDDGHFVRNGDIVLEPGESMYFLVPTGLSTEIALNPFLIRNDMALNMNFTQYSN